MTFNNDLAPVPVIDSKVQQVKQASIHFKEHKNKTVSINAHQEKRAMKQFSTKRNQSIKNSMQTQLANADWAVKVEVSQGTVLKFCF